MFWTQRRSRDRVEGKDGTKAVTGYCVLEEFPLMHLIATQRRR
jgi:hypothetical protein